MAPRNSQLAAHIRQRGRAPCFWAACALVAGLSLPALGADLGAAQKAVRLQDFATAYEIYQQAAEQGSAEAQYQLALLLAKGRGSVPQDSERARHWLEQAASAAHPGARYSLALQVAEEQPERAQSLLKAAAEQGYRAARSQLERLQDQLAEQDDATPLEDQWFGAARMDELGALQRLHEQGVDINTRNDAGRTALFIAVEHGSEGALQWLIEQGSDIDAEDKFGLTATQTAIERAQLGALKTLLAAGADKTQTFRNGDNLLHYAVRKGRPRTTQYLIAQGVPLNQQNKEGWTPLDLAEYKKQSRLVAALQAAGARHGGGWRQDRQAVDVAKLAQQLQDRGVENPVSLAVANGNVRLLRQLLEDNPQWRDQPLADGATPLIMAIKQNKPEVVATLLAMGAEVNASAFRGTTPLQLAVRENRPTIVDDLLAAGADPLQQNEAGLDSIATAIDAEQAQLAQRLLDSVLGDINSPTAARRLIESGQIPVDLYLLKATKHHLPAVSDRLLPVLGETSATDELGRNALWFAAKEGNTPLVKKLLDAGVDPTQRDHLGLTPFLVAVENACLECARLLLPANTIDQTSDSGNTALMLAAQNADALLTAWLIQNQANLELRNQRGNTAIMEAVNSGSMDVVRLLLKADANVTRKNELGFSAIDLAKQVSPEMEKLVKSKSVLGLF